MKIFILLSLKDEIIDRVQVHIAGCRSCGKERSPLPAVVFCIEEEVRANNGDTDCDYQQDQEDEEHEPIHVVDFVSPERGKNEVPEMEY